MKQKYKIVRRDLEQLLNNKYSLGKISRMWSIPLPCLRYYCARQNIPYDQNFRNRGLINHSYFDSIDTPIKAYLLGNFIADGCIEIRKNSSNGINPTKRLLLGVQKRDISILDLVKSEISPNSNLIEIGYKCRLNITSEGIVNTLFNKYRIITNKTYDLDFRFDFNLIPVNLLRDFIVGLLDGDGTVYWNKQYKRVYYIGFCSLQKGFLEQIGNIFKDKFNLTYKLSERKAQYLGGSPTITLKIHIPRVREEQIYNYLYSNSKFCLERKRSKFSNQYRGNSSSKEAITP